MYMKTVDIVGVVVMVGMVVVALEGELWLTW